MKDSEKPTKEQAAARLRASLPPRRPNGNKGTYGNAVLVAGSRAYTGAPMLSAMGALATGAGIVHLLAEEAALLPTRIRLPEVVCHPSTDAAHALSLAEAVGGRRGAILIGPGLSLSAAAAEAFHTSLHTLLRTPGLPLVLDAGALSAMATQKEAYFAAMAEAKRPLILTPHPMEFSRLTGLPLSEIEADRAGSARTFAEKTGTVLLLKGHGTVITDGTRLTVNPSGSAALAKGGTGDVLAGAITGLLCSGMEPYEAAAAGAYLHGAAGDMLEKTCSPYGLFPSSLAGAMAGELCRILAD